MFDLKHLRVLKEIAERGSFSAAAEALHYTQPAVSQQIAALERQAGVRLVDRTPRGIHLTEAGRALLGHAEAILARLADAEAELEALSDLRGGRVRLASFPTGGASLVPVAAAAFRERHPGIEIEISVAEPPSALEGLKASEVDIALVVESGFEPGARDERIERTHLLDDPMFVALPRDHPLARKRTLRLADLADETWMHDGSACPDAAIFLRACHAAGFEPRVAFQNDDYMAIQGFIAAGAGVALIPQLALQGVRDDVVVRALAGPAPVRQVVAATLADGYRSPATEAMLEALRDVSAGYLERSASPLAAAAAS
jgi:DNA-binding transcriptional LysR family regulator